MPEKTIFSRIIDREIPADIVYEDDLCLAIRDISPQAPVHVLVFPKKVVVSTSDITEEDAPLIGHIYLVIQKLADQLGISEEGYRVVSNCRTNAGQTVPHLHFHILGGRSFNWPPG
ncbi:MAG: histidine triad nucleotide-binding protein [Planctomycetia bacterium]|nr:histidine triad nucleotide-binding protein [Planctomycetia bacterium]